MQHVQEGEGVGAADGLVGGCEEGPEGGEDGVAEVAGGDLGLERVDWREGVC